MTEVQRATGPVPHDRRRSDARARAPARGAWPARGLSPWRYDDERLLEHVVAELRDPYEAGIRTIVDVTTPDLGRPPALIRVASERSGIHVVMATGICLDMSAAV